eukprot:2466400-Rhodomonas_salina.1
MSSALRSLLSPRPLAAALSLSRSRALALSLAVCLSLSAVCLSLARSLARSLPLPAVCYGNVASFHLGLLILHHSICISDHACEHAGQQCEALPNALTESC